MPSDHGNSGNLSGIESRLNSVYASHGIRILSGVKRIIQRHDDLMSLNPWWLEGVIVSPSLCKSPKLVLVPDMASANANPETKISLAWLAASSP